MVCLAADPQRPAVVDADALAAAAARERVRDDDLETTTTCRSADGRTVRLPVTHDDDEGWNNGRARLVRDDDDDDLAARGGQRRAREPDGRARRAQVRALTQRPEHLIDAGR